MYASSQRHPQTCSELFRDFAAASSATLVACWVGLLVLEVMRTGDVIPNVHSFPQAVVLAFIFLSYAISWRHELLGGLLAIVGTMLFFLVSYLGVLLMPPLPAAWFAVPGILYLLAWSFRDKQVKA